MIMLGVLDTGIHCVGRLEADGSLSNVYIVSVQYYKQGDPTVICDLVSPFHPFDQDEPLKAVNSQRILGTMVPPKELMDKYRDRVDGVTSSVRKNVEAMKFERKG